MTQEPIVIVGGGHAAAQLCNQLAEQGAGPRVHLVAEENAYPYHRPPLSKTFLKASTEGAQLHRDEAWYLQQGFHLHLGVAAAAIDRQAKEVVLASGVRLPYGRLVLATGTRARQLPQIDKPYANVLSLRTVADAQVLRERLLAPGGGTLTIVGGGFIGLEVAATARHLGWQVTLLEAAPRLLARSASPQLAAAILEHQKGLGCDVRLGVRIEAVEAAGDVLETITVNGDRLPVQHLLVGIGAVPETSLALAAGLAIDNGVVVDAHMTTSDPDVLAIGDCCAFEFRGSRIRLESVQNANDQAKIAAATLLGKLATYSPTPWFWSDQSTLKLQMVGLWREGLQAHRRPGATTGSFSLFHYDGSDLVCVESASAPMDHMMARRLLERGISPAADRVANPAVALKSLVA